MSTEVQKTQPQSQKYKGLPSCSVMVTFCVKILAISSLEKYKKAHPAFKKGIKIAMILVTPWN